MEKEHLLPSSSNPQSNLETPIWSNDSKRKLQKTNSAPSMSTFNENHPPVPPPFGKNSIVKQAVILLIVYLTIGVTLFSFFNDQFKSTKTHPIVDALYYCILTICAIGYSDITPDTPLTKSFAILFVLVGFGFIHILLTRLVTYVVDFQENYYLWRTNKIKGYPYVAIGVLVVCIGIGVVFMHFVEKIGWFDSLYLSVVGVTSVGYGEKVFKSRGGRIFASLWLLLSTLAVARAFLVLAEYSADKRQRQLENWVLQQDITLQQFHNNGFLSKSEYVLYKLEQMGKITEKEVLLITKHFERLDTGNCGRITLSNLMESHY